MAGLGRGRGRAGPATRARSRPSSRAPSSPRRRCASSPRPPRARSAENEVVKALTDMGYKATDATKEALIDGLDAVEELTGGSVVKQARDARKRRLPDELGHRPPDPQGAAQQRAAPLAAPFIDLSRRRPSLDSAQRTRTKGTGRVAEVEIGIGKSGRRAYGFDDIAIVPSRRTRDPEDVDISWEIDAFRFELPLMALGHGRRRQPGHRHRDRPARRRRRAQPRGPVDPLRGPRAAARRDRRAAGRQGHRCGCRRSTPSRSSPS